MNALGTQILLELKGCDKRLLNDLTYVRETLVDIARKVGLHIIGESFHKFAPQGVTGILAIAESHISIHTWPEYGYAAADVFTCGEPDQARRAADLLVERFGTREHTRTELQRGRATQPLPAVTSTHR